jgi:hypothetical protein
MRQGLNNKLAGQIGEYLVCAELGKRGYIATSFAGNVPEFDLIVANDNLDTIPIQVKTTRGHSWPTRANLWINIEIDEINKKQVDHGNQIISNPDLVYVCVALSEPDSNEKDRYFILLKKDIQSICAANYRAWMLKHNWKRPRNYKSLDNRYEIDNMIKFENNWNLIEQALQKPSTYKASDRQ